MVEFCYIIVGRICYIFGSLWLCESLFLSSTQVGIELLNWLLKATDLSIQI